MITIFIVYKWRLSGISFKEKTCLFTSLLRFLVYRLFTWCICQCFVDVIDCRLIETKKKRKKKEIAVKIIFITDQVRNAAQVCECCS